MDFAGGHPGALKLPSHAEPQQTTDEKRSEFFTTIITHRYPTETKEYHLKIV